MAWRASALLGDDGARGRYAASSLAGQVVIAATFLVGSVAAARLFGPEGKGELTGWLLGLVFTAAVLSGSVPTGLGRATLRGAGPATLPAARHLGLALLITAPAGAIAAAAGAEPVPVLCVGVVGVPALVAVNDVLVPMQAEKRAFAFQTMRLVRPAVVSVGLLDHMPR